MKLKLSAPLAPIALVMTMLAVPALAADETMPMHHHHHKMHGKMSKSSSDDMETAKLNEQSLMNARGGTSGTSSPAATMPAPSTGTTMAPGTGTMPPASGAMGTMAPGNAPMTTTPPAMPAPK